MFDFPSAARSTHWDIRGGNAIVFIEVIYHRHKQNGRVIFPHVRPSNFFLDNPRVVIVFLRAGCTS